MVIQCKAWGCLAVGLKTSSSRLASFRPREIERPHRFARCQSLAEMPVRGRLRVRRRTDALVQGKSPADSVVPPPFLTVPIHNCIRTRLSALSASLIWLGKISRMAGALSGVEIQYRARRNNAGRVYLPMAQASARAGIPARDTATRRAV